MTSPRIGIVGPGRTRNGLGPFLATAFEAAGARVVGVAGRSRESTAPAAAALGERLGHAVDCFASARELAAAVDALVVASPMPAHIEGLEAALAAGIPCLCEKPLVAPAATARGLELVAGFARAGLLLAENCQWPFVLDAAAALWPDLRLGAVRSLAMGLGPTGRGRAMILDSLSHVLSVAQAVAPIDAMAPLPAVTEDDPGPDAAANVLRFALPCQGGGALAVRLHLQHCPRQPRPAWLEFDDRRVDRVLGPGYDWALTTPDGRRQPLPDPMHALVYRFAAALTPSRLDDPCPKPGAIAARLRLFDAIVRALDGC